MAISEHLTNARRGLAPALIPPPPSVKFKENYRIGEMACLKAFRAATKPGLTWTLDEVR